VQFACDSFLFQSIYVNLVDRKYDIYKIMRLPSYIKTIIKKLKKAHLEAYAVGGCVRDFLRGVKPKDWDITTNAKPKEIQEIFPNSIYENKFGTVAVKVQSSHRRQSGYGASATKFKVQSQKRKTESRKRKKSEVTLVEVTTYRIDEQYTDKRHPDRVKFTSSLEKDLSRRDFTINAMALNWQEKAKGKRYEVVDLFDGQKDLKNRIIRTVGNPDKRFSEDALRMLRAVRFATTLQFIIEPKTYQAIKRNAELIKIISKERIRDEFMKIVSSSSPAQGILYLHDLGLLKQIIPEIEQGINITQNWHHVYTIFQHAILSSCYCPSKDPLVRLACLFHDISKPETKVDLGYRSTFYQHQIVGAKKTENIMRRLKFSNKEIKKVSHLVKHHMFYYNVGEITDKGVRRLLRRVGKENLKDLMDVRIADRLGSGCPKAKPYKLIELEKRIKEIQKEPITVKMLKINGHDVMEILKIKSGPKIGKILNALLEEILDEPRRNTKKYLIKRVKELGEANRY